MAESPEQNKAEQTNAPPVTLAIVPFRLLRGEKKTPLGVGLADALMIRLHDVKGLVVRPTGAVLPLAEKIEDSFELGRKLGVDYVLDGHILPADSRTRFSVQLLDIANQSVLWASQFDETEADIFHLEDSISARIVELLLPELASKTNKQKDNKDFSKTPNSFSETTGEVREKDPDTNPLHESAEKPITLSEEAAEKKRAFNPLLIAAIVFAALAVCATAYFLSRPAPKQTPGQAKTLVILPFKSETAATNSVGSGMADALSGKLGAVSAVSVLSSNAGREIAKRENETNESAQRLGADYVLRGSLQNGGEKSVLDAELVNSENGQNLFSEKFTARAGDLLTLQNLVAERVLNALAISPTREERVRMNKRHTENPLAYELYLIGRFQMASRTPENLRRAIQIFTQASERDQNFALPYVGIADCYSLLALYDIPPPPDAYKIAEQNALRALALDENLSEAHASIGYIRFNAERNFEAAEKEFRRAIELNPSYVSSHHWFALALTGVGRFDDALAEIKTAQRLDPTAASVRSAAGMVYFRSRRYEEALAETSAALEINRAFVPAHKTARWIHQKMGNYSQALDAFQKERSYSGANENDLGWLVIQAQVEALSDNREKAAELLKKALNDKFVQQNPTSFANEIALAYVALNDRENAFAWLEKAYLANDHSMCFISVEPRFDSISQDSRFIALVQKSKTQN